MQSDVATTAQRSRASSAFEAELRRLLNGYNGRDICGLWID